MSKNHSIPTRAVARRRAQGLIVIALALLSVGCATSKERYLISYYDSNENTEIEIASTREYADAMAEHSGHLIVEPIKNQGQITNPAMPEYTSRMPGEYMSIAVFPSLKKLRSFVESNPEVQGGDDVELRALVAAKVFKPMPTMPDLPVIGSGNHRKAPAFILVNGISMHSMANPMTTIRMMRYMISHVSKLKALDVEMLSSFKTIDVIEGDFDYDMLFLTEWPSEAVFNKVHSDPEFVKLAGKTRNRAFKRFSDDRGDIQTKFFANTN